jgi:nucleoside-triphosphatase THEP1
MNSIQLEDCPVISILDNNYMHHYRVSKSEDKMVVCDEIGRYELLVFTESEFKEAFRAITEEEYNEYAQLVEEGFTEPLDAYLRNLEAKYIINQ